MWSNGNGKSILVLRLEMNVMEKLSAIFMT
jgi:hypothetical protein